MSDLPFIPVIPSGCVFPLPCSPGDFFCSQDGCVKILDHISIGIAQSLATVYVFLPTESFQHSSGLPYRLPLLAGSLRSSAFMNLNDTERMHPSQRGIKSTIIGVLLNISLAVIKAIAGVVGNSYALVADAIESSFDVFTSLITWIGLKTASKAPDEDHPYGHGKAEPLAAIVVSLSLIAAAILIAIQSIKNIRTPHDPPAAFTLLVLALVIIVKEGLFRFVDKVGTEVESSAVKAEAWHHRSDAITSATAFIGISIALIGGKGYESADDYAALIASCIIVFNAYLIFMPSFAEIMDKAPAGNLVEEVKQIALTVKGVKGVDKCFVRKMGFDYFVDIHVLVDGNLPVRTGHEIAHAVKNAVLQAKPTVYDVLTHIEPA